MTRPDELTYGQKNYKPTGGPTGYAGMKPPGKGRKVCSCGFRIRGAKHEEGTQHNVGRKQG